MLVIICAKYEKNTFRIVGATERIWQDVPYYNICYNSHCLMTLNINNIVKSHHTHTLMLGIICTEYGKNLSRTASATEQKQGIRDTWTDRVYPVDELWWIITHTSFHGHRFVHNVPIENLSLLTITGSTVINFRCKIGISNGVGPYWLSMLINSDDVCKEGVFWHVFFNMLCAFWCYITF